jgi:thiosulfate/3-mercaptopyruvate sulfurtransferase
VLVLIHPDTVDPDMFGRVTVEFAHPEYLVSTGWLADHLDDPRVVVVDVTARLTRSLDNTARTECFERSRIPGSRWFDIASGHGALSDPTHDLPWMWPTAERIETSLRSCGVRSGDRVVVAARTPRPGVDAGTMWCTRAWWTLHHSGLDVAILHGGLERWEAEGRPLEHGPSRHVDEGDVVVDRAIASAGLSARAESTDVLAALVDGCVVDALSAANFDGDEPGYGPRRGHITGAVNLPATSLIEAETAAFLPPDQLRARLDDLGLLDRRQIVSYCGGAIAATVIAFGLALFGHRSVAVYDGSLMEWSRRDDLPMTDPSRER